MSFKRNILAGVSSLAILSTVIVTPQSSVYAIATYATPKELVKEFITTATAGIDNSSLPTAKTAIADKITIVGDEVFYDSNSIGYWFSDESHVLYENSGRTKTLLEETADGFDVHPTFVASIIGDLNDNLVENYVPTTTDWSKIIGKYDVTLGDITIPADQWITVSGTLPVGINAAASAAQNINITTLSGKKADNCTDITDTVGVFAWHIDTNGDLYIQDQMTFAVAEGSVWRLYVDKVSGTFSSAGGISGYGSSSGSVSQVPYIRTALSANGTTLNAKLLLTDAINGNAFSTNSSDLCTMRKISNLPTTLVTSPSLGKSSGVVYVLTSQIGVTGTTAANNIHAKHLTMFDSQSCSKEVVGSAMLKKRLAKLSMLDSGDRLLISDTYWKVNGTTDIDELIGYQSIDNPGDSADIDIVAEFEPLAFKVLVPTVLPIYVDLVGTVTTATNATVQNKSNAAVKITDLDIVAKPESGWTLVDGTPSTTKDANELSFTTSLAVNDTLAAGQTLPFTYDAKLSPITAGVESVDLATMTITVDWAE